MQEKKEWAEKLKSEQPAPVEVAEPPPAKETGKQLAAALSSVVSFVKAKKCAARRPRRGLESLARLAREQAPPWPLALSRARPALRPLLLLLTRAGRRPFALSPRRKLLLFGYLFLFFFEGPLVRTGPLAWQRAMSVVLLPLAYLKLALAKILVAVTSPLAA